MTTYIYSLKLEKQSLLILSLFGCLTFNACQPQQTSVKPNSVSLDTISQERITPDTAIGPVTAPTPIPTKPSVARPKGTIALPCDSSDFNLTRAVNQAADILSGTPYSQANKTDCSGMYHMVLNELRKSCPDALMPTIDQARSSRDLAVWYHKKGVLQIVQDPQAMMDRIQPGAVMFYGYGSQLGQYNAQNLVIDSLRIRGKGINHVSIITKVERDEKGLVTSYDMFHGRNPKHPAGITTSRRVYQNRSMLPMYGNWKETWVGVVKMPMVN